MRTRLALYVWALDPTRTLTAPATPWSEPRRSRGPNGTSPFGSAGRGRAPLSRFGANATTVRRSRAAPHGLGGLKDVGAEGHAEAGSNRRVCPGPGFAVFSPCGNSGRRRPAAVSVAPTGPERLSAIPLEESARRAPRCTTRGFFQRDRTQPLGAGWKN